MKARVEDSKDVKAEEEVREEELLEAREAEAERREKEEHGKAAAAAAAAHEHPHAEAPKHEMTKEEALLDQELRAELAAELGE